MTDEQLARMAELQEQGLSYRAIGREVGCDGTTVRRWLDPVVAEKHRESSLRYRAAHLEQERERNRRYKTENPEKVRDYMRRWREENSEKGVLI
jgi:hypothetical protein